MKNRFLLFILGFISGILLIGACIGVGAGGYIAGNYLIDKITAINTPKAPVIHIPGSLNLDFESAADGEIFNPQDSAQEISDKFSTSGKHSLLVEFPGGRPTPGIFFDITGSGCLNWNKMKVFSFNVFNSIDAKTNLAVRIKSGEKYPKRVFMKGFELPALSWTTINIARNELEGKLDLDKISYLGFIITDPATTFKLYFDEMKVTNENE